MVNNQDIIDTVMFKQKTQLLKQKKNYERYIVRSQMFSFLKALHEGLGQVLYEQIKLL